MLLTIKRNGQVVNTIEDPGMITESFISNLWAYSRKYPSVKRMKTTGAGYDIVVTFYLNENIEGTKSLQYIYQIPQSWGGPDTYEMIQAVQQGR